MEELRDFLQSDASNETNFLILILELFDNVGTYSYFDNDAVKSLLQRVKTAVYKDSLKQIIDHYLIRKRDYSDEANQFLVSTIERFSENNLLANEILRYLQTDTEDILYDHPYELFEKIILYRRNSGLYFMIQNVWKQGKKELENFIRDFKNIRAYHYLYVLIGDEQNNEILRFLLDYYNVESYMDNIEHLLVYSLSLQHVSFFDMLYQIIIEEMDDDIEFPYSEFEEIQYYDESMFAYLLDHFLFHELELIYCFGNKKYKLPEEFITRIIHQEEFDLEYEYKEVKMYEILIVYGYKKHVLEVFDTYNNEMHKIDYDDMGTKNKNALEVKEYMAVFSNKNLHADEILDVLLYIDSREYLASNPSVVYYALKHLEKHELVSLIIQEGLINNEAYKAHLLRYDGGLLWRIIDKDSVAMFQYCIENVISPLHVFPPPTKKFKKIPIFSLAYLSKNPNFYKVIKGKYNMSKKYLHEYHYPVVIAAAFNNYEGLKYLINEGFELYRKGSWIENVYAFLDEDTDPKIVELLEEHLPRIYVLRAKFHMKHQKLEIALLLLAMLLVLTIMTVIILNTLNVIHLF